MKPRRFVVLSCPPRLGDGYRATPKDGARSASAETSQSASSLDARW
jgi:hypothetical protein